MLPALWAARRCQTKVRGAKCAKWGHEPGLHEHGQSGPPQSAHGAPAGHIDGCCLGAQVAPGANPLVAVGSWLAPAALFLRKHLPCAWPELWKVQAAQPSKLPHSVQQLSTVWPAPPPTVPDPITC